MFYGNFSSTHVYVLRSEGINRASRVPRSLNSLKFKRMSAKQRSQYTKRSSRQEEAYAARRMLKQCLRLLSQQLTTLLACCCRRKRFIASLLKQVGNDCILLAVRGCDAAQEALCLMLEWRLLPNEEARLQIVNALESTDSGKERYAALCQRQKNLQELVSELAIHSRPPQRGGGGGKLLCIILRLRAKERRRNELERSTSLREASFWRFSNPIARLSCRNTITVAHNVIFLFGNNITGSCSSCIRF